MGNNPAQSVVNAFSRAHDVPNLFIVDGSNFVTSARQQPTATIQTLAYRAADHMVTAARKGELSSPSRDFSQTRSKGNRQDGVNQQSWEKVRKTIG
jgi:choline dehydrogenase-like flavoprotein